jgi:hypothetical protein
VQDKIQGAFLSKEQIEFSLYCLYGKIVTLGEKPKGATYLDNLLAERIFGA